MRYAFWYAAFLSLELELVNHIFMQSGKRLFRIWLCMPLREVSAINARSEISQPRSTETH